ncbi:MAG: DNA metabolism protein [Flavobacteriaceae bacterium]|nr:DNA metabolism protein [Flavobacteriaceae bacterium]
MRSLLVYDGTFEGFLSTVFHCYEYKITECSIQKQKKIELGFFEKPVHILTDPVNAERVWEGLQKKAPKFYSSIFKAFLSEEDSIEDQLLYLIQRIFRGDDRPEKDHSDERILHIAQVIKKVHREKHRMEAFVRFRLTKDGIYMATVSPDFDVLPLINRHFKHRYADQRWLIYDVKRNYGIYYDLSKVETIVLEEMPPIQNNVDDHLIFTPEELHFETLWKNYFRSTNIASRKNLKLHLQHVPKRYWRYLSEKQPM